MSLIEDAILRSFAHHKRAVLLEDDILDYVSYRIPELVQYLGRDGMDQLVPLIRRYIHLRPDLYRQYTRRNGRVLHWKYVGGLIDCRSGAGDCFVVFDNNQPQQATSTASNTGRRMLRCRRRRRMSPKWMAMRASTSAASSHKGRKRLRDNIDESVERELKRLRSESSGSSDDDDFPDYEEYEDP